MSDLTGVIVDAIIASGVPGGAAEAGARLAEAFAMDMPSRPDSAWRTIAVESPWFIRLEEKTVVVGVQDRLAEAVPNGIVWGCEWKSRKAPKIKKDGQPYKGDTEEDWLAEISGGPQLRIYALAQQAGTYVREDGGTFTLSSPSPHLLVRAVVKSTPEVVWPTARDG